MPATAVAAVDTPRRVDIPGTDHGLDLHTMGGRIAWSRLRREMTQAAVAKNLGLSRATIVQYEKDNILPPIPAVERLAKVLDVSPEFLAFGRQGVDALNNAAEEIVTMAEVSQGSSGLFESGAFAMPKKVFEGKDMDTTRTKMFVLDHDEDEFGFSDGDRLIIDQGVKDIHASDHILFLVETSDGPAVMRREPNVGAADKGEVVLTNGRGVSQAIREKSFKVLGAINGVLSLV